MQDPHIHLRIENMCNRMKDCELDQIIVSDVWSIYYYTGIKISSGDRLTALVIRSDGQHCLIVNQLFSIQNNQIHVVYYHDSEDPAQLMAKYLDREKTLGIDRNFPGGYLLCLIRNHTARTYIDISYIIASQRGVKDTREREMLRRSSDINDKTMQQILTSIHKGITEQEIARVVVCAYKQYGAEGCCFDPIVAFGENTADCHHIPSSRKLMKGDCILIDIGCLYGGYCSDMTRTFFTDEPTALQKEIYELVENANCGAESHVLPGRTLSSIDTCARRIISDGGYGSNFIHRLGHFIGLQDHDPGNVSASNNGAIQEGMAFTIEPGIYLPRSYGVRIEDVVIASSAGCEILNQFTKRMTVIGI